jgi:cysteinyl-tRNA synthetase
MKSPPRSQDETPTAAAEARLRLHNTRTGDEEDFAPIDPRAVRLYVCGPTVYDFAHIGNARPVIVFDVLFRLLKHIYPEKEIIYARNITDVDDKINARAERDYPGLPLNEAIAKVTAATERQFHEDVAELGCLRPTFEPRATEFIGKMRAMIERLIDRGVAYAAEDHVLFSPNAMDAVPWAPRYGTLAHRSLDEMLAGARIDVAPYKRDPMDFVLWKPSKPNEPGWPSPAGIAAPGRPGWHIECSAMSMATLLAPFGGGLFCDDPSRNVFDIHGGGVDLVFPHHENEIAQSCCALGSSRMANFWVHNGFLQVEGEKMSKSRGNFVTIHELLRTTKFGNSTWPGDVLRLAMLRTRYRQPIDWTVKELERAWNDLRVWYELTDYSLTDNVMFPDQEVDADVVRALCEDLNTHSAIDRLRELANDGKFGTLRASLRFLGFSCDRSQLVRNIAATARAQGTAAATAAGDVTVQLGVTEAPDQVMFQLTTGKTTTDESTQRQIDEVIARRKEARAARNWAEADRLRDQLSAMGVAIKDNKDGTTSWELKR